MIRSTLGFMLGAALLSCAHNALADELQDAGGEAGASVDSGLGVDLQATPTVTLGDVCYRSSDVISCEPGRLLLGGSATLRAELSRQLWLGPTVMLGTDGGARSAQGADGVEPVTLSSQVAVVAADLFYFPFAGHGVSLAPRLGLTALRNVVEGPSGRQSDVAYAPTLGVGLSYDLGVSDRVALTFKGRADYVFLDGRGYDLDPGRQGWNAGVWVGLGLGVLVYV